MLKKLLSVYGSNFALGVLGIITIPILLNNVGTEGYGYYAIYLTILSYFSLFELGVLKHITKLISQNASTVDDIISCFYYTTIGMVLLLSPITLIVINVLYPISLYEVLLLVIMASLEYIFYLSTKIFSAYSTANKNFEKLSLYNFTSGSIRYFLIIFGALVFNDIFIVILLLVVRRIFDIKLSKKILKIDIKLFDMKKVTISNLRKTIGLYKESILLSGTQAIQINVSALISMLISRLFGVQELGVYRSIVDLFSKIYFFSNGLGLVIFPYFVGSNSKESNNNKYISISWLFYSLIYLMILLLFPMINTIFLGGIVNSNVEMWTALIIIVSILIVAQGNLSFEYLQAKGLYSYLLKVAILSSILFVLAITVLYKLNFGLLSILIAWLIYIIVQNISYQWRMLNRSKIAPIIDSVIIIVWLFVGSLILG